MAEQSATLSASNPNHPIGPQTAAAMPYPRMPFLKITVSGSDGGATEKELMAPIKIAIPRELSLRIATMHVMEFVMKEFKRIVFKDALKAIGLK
jgi:hypothetical protein